jgi:hypothetical protein
VTRCRAARRRAQEIEPRSPELPGRYAQEKRGKRAFCAYCRQHKEDWRPYKHGQVSRAFGTDVTNRIPNTIPNGRGKKDTWGYRIRGSKTVCYCRTWNVALCKLAAAGICGISRVTPSSKYPRNLHVLNDLCLWGFQSPLCYSQSILSYGLLPVL